jgi:probable F420-dependent oxidoreductase
VKLGLRLPSYGPVASPPAIRAAAEMAEGDGWHSVWASDRVAVPSQRAGELTFLDDYVQTYESLITLAFVASVTGRVRLGTSAIVVPQRQIMLLARQVASLDAFSDGRLILGVGAGWAEAEFSAAGACDRFSVRGAVLDEAIVALRTLWSATSPAEFHGQHVAFPPVDFAPRPVQPAGIPIIIAGNSAAARRRAARVGDGWNPTALGAPETAAGLAEIHALRQAINQDAPGADRRRPFASIGSLRFPGSAAEANATLEPYAEIGLDVMICGFPTSDPTDFLARVRTFTREVLPRFT